MSELEQIEGVLRNTARRQRWLNLWHGAWLGLLFGGGIWVLGLGAYKLLPIPTWVPMAGVGVGVVTVLVVMLVWGWRGRTLLETARWVDRKRDLKERLSTALELSGGSRDRDWERLLVADAASHVRGIDPKGLLPLTLPPVARWALLVVVLGVGLGWVPEYRTQPRLQAQKEKENIRETGRQLAELTRRNLAVRPPALAATEKALQEVTELGELLSKVSLTRSEALDDLASVAKKLGEQLDQMENSPALKALERAARESPGLPSQMPQELQKQIEAMEKALGEAAGQEEALDKLQKDLQKLGKAAKAMAGAGQGVDGAAKAEMAQAMAAMAQQARDLGAALPDLEAAIQALEQNQTDLFLSELGAAMDDLEQVKQLAQAVQQLQQQQAQVGKDLPAQLEKGQAQAAMGTLQRMMEQLRSAAPTEAELEAIREEVARAVQPGSGLGKVGEHLEQASARLGKGDREAGAESLAAAAKELEDLMKQLQDSEGLQSAMESLARAEQAIAMGKSWSQCMGQPCGDCQGGGCQACAGMGTRFGQGRGGAGVGTWADDSNMNYSMSDEMVDNSGFLRPDMDSRGVADRGEGALNPNLRPDKVRGQLAPGTSMPSITLKGVSIRGTSNVEFEEAATAAQVDAQSALNQDRVPRAYRGAVRDYFDDLKK